MTEHQDRLQWLYHRFIHNLATPQELAEFWKAMDELKDDDPVKEAIFLQYGEKVPPAMQQHLPDWNKAMKKIMNAPPSAPKAALLSIKRKWYWAAAALVFMVSGTIAYRSFTNEKKSLPVANTKTNRYKNDIAPGRNGAILTLSDGSTVNLDTAQNGLLAVQGKTKLTTANGSINYEKTKATGGEPIYNMINTPRGRQYKVVLCDGSQVWLNAASSIRYPAVFEGAQRKVQITGEAYFEIAAAYSKSGKEKIPFIVQFTTPSGYSGEVNVLGTHFNLNAYAEETAVKTTLLEGSVKVSLDNNESALLQPGEQVGIGKNGKMKVSGDVDVDAVMAWKNGYFSFNKTDMATLMREISRWYDVEIEYAGAVPDRKFGGEISRSSNASDVLKIMEESKVYFKIEGKKIIVLPEKQ
ncbi:MAG: FecR family protein [Agriterribacter sp.]